MGAAGLGYIILDGETGKGPIAKFLPPDALKALVAKCGVKSGDAVFFSADAKTQRAAILAGHARTRHVERPPPVSAGCGGRLEGGREPFLLRCRQEGKERRAG